MPQPISGRQGELAFAKQTAEGTVNTAPTFGVPFAGGGLKIDQGVNPFEVTDTSQVETTQEYKEMISLGGTATIIGVPKAPGLLLLGAMGAVTSVGPTNFTHTFTFSADDSGLPWLTFFEQIGGQYFRFTDCKVDQLAFNWNAGRPVTIEAQIRGKTPEQLAAAYTAPTTAEGLASVFMYAGSTMKFDEDTSPAATQHRNITSAKVTIRRNLIVQQTDALSPQYVFSPTYAVDVEIGMWWEDAKILKSTYFGSITGLTPSRVVVYGAIDFLSTGTADATNHQLQLKVPNVALRAELPEPVVDGQPVALTVSGRAVKPTSGSLATVILKNQVASY